MVLIKVLLSSVTDVNFFKMDGTSIRISYKHLIDSSVVECIGVIRLGGSGGPNSPTDNTTGIY